MTTFFVSTTGHDNNNDGLSTSAPKRTVNACISAGASTGDTIEFAAGTYGQTELEYSPSVNTQILFANKRINMIGAAGATVIFESFSDKDYLLRYNDLNGSGTSSPETVTIQNIHFRNSSSNDTTGSFLYLDQSASDDTPFQMNVIDCTFTQVDGDADMSTGMIYLDNSQDMDVTIDNCTFNLCDVRAMNMDLHDSNIDIKNSTFTITGDLDSGEDSFNSVIFIYPTDGWSTGNSFTFRNNTYHQILGETTSTTRGIQIRGIKDINIHDNIFKVTQDSDKATYYLVYLQNTDDNAANDIETINFSGNTVNRADFKGFAFYYDNEASSDTHPNEVTSATINDNHFIGSSAYEDNVNSGCIFWEEDNSTPATGAVLEIKRNFFTRVNDGIKIDSQNLSTIEGNTFYNIGQFSGTDQSATNPLGVWMNASNTATIKNNDFIQDTTTAKGVAFYLEGTDHVVTGNKCYHAVLKDASDRCRLVNGITGSTFTATNNTYINVENMNSNTIAKVNNSGKTKSTYAEADDISYSNLTKSITNHNSNLFIKNHITKPLGL